MFGSGLILAGTLLHVYAFWRAASVPFVARRVPRVLLIGGGPALWGLFLLGRLYGHGGTGVLAVSLEVLGLTWFAALFLTCVALFAADLATGFGFLLPRLAPRLRGWALVAGGLLSAIALVQGLRPPVVRNYEVRLPGLPEAADGTRLVALSDLHVGSLRGPRWLGEQVSRVEALHPDLVVLLGDTFEGHGAPSEEAWAVLGRLVAPLGVWAVPGNHEFHGAGARTLALLEASGVRVLRNRWAEVRPGLAIAGVDDVRAGRRPEAAAAAVAGALAGRPAGATILLSHAPVGAGGAARAGAGLMLSGHTHGGQVWPFGYLVRFRYPLLAGAYRVDGMAVIVCRGTGSWGPPMRLWQPAEILQVTLRAS